MLYLPFGDSCWAQLIKNCAMDTVAWHLYSKKHLLFYQFQGCQNMTRGQGGGAENDDVIYEQSLSSARCSLKIHIIRQRWHFASKAFNAILLLLKYSKNHELLVLDSRIFEMLALFIRHLVPPFACLLTFTFHQCQLQHTLTPSFGFRKVNMCAKMN